MAYGSPATEADVAAYYTHIRGGRPPSPEALEELLQRYRAINGSPLTEITRAQAEALSGRTGLPVDLRVDLAGFTGSDQDFIRSFFVPGIQRAGGLRAARLAAGVP